MTAKLSKFRFVQLNVNGWHKRVRELEMDVEMGKPVCCILQECFRSRTAVADFIVGASKYGVLNGKYVMECSDSGRAAVAVRNDVRAERVALVSDGAALPAATLETCGFESVWLQLTFATTKKTERIIVGSVYRTPDVAHPFVSARLQEELDCVKKLKLPFLFGGDFNARAPVWCTESCDTGATLQQLIVDNGLSLLNRWNVATYVSSKGRGCVLDLTVAEPRLRAMMSNWFVSGEFGRCADHLAIQFDLDFEMVYNEPAPLEQWEVGKMDVSSFKAAMAFEARSIANEYDLTEW